MYSRSTAQGMSNTDKPLPSSKSSTDSDLAASSDSWVHVSDSGSNKNSDFSSEGATSQQESNFDNSDYEKENFNTTAPDQGKANAFFSPASILEDKIFRPIQRIFYRKATVNEKSSLVKNETGMAEDEVIMPELSDPTSCNRKYGELPEGIGTGNYKLDHEANSNLSLDDEISKQRLIDADAAKGLAVSFLGAGVMYGLAAVFVRSAGNNGVGPMEALFARSVFQTIVFGTVLLFNGIGWRPPRGRTIRCILISIAYCVGTMSSYEAFDVIPPGAAVSTRGAARTIFSMIFAYIILREKVSIGDAIGLLCCFVGIGLIITSGMTSGDKDYILPPGLDNNAIVVRVYGYSLLIASAIGRSLGHVAVRGAKEDLNTFTIVFYHSALTVFFAAILLFTVRLPSWPPSWAGVGYVALTCVASSIATFSSNQALKYAHPALVSFGQNADVVVSVTLQHAILHMPPKALELLGVASIFFGLCGLTLYKWRKSKKYNGDHERLQ